MCAARLSVRFRIDASTVEHRSETIGVSPRHLIISSPIELETGLQIVMRIQAPVEVFSKSFCDGELVVCEVEIAGQVVCGGTLADGVCSYQIAVDGW
jgi:hypothetical protein